MDTFWIIQKNIRVTLHSTILLTKLYTVRKSTMHSCAFNIASHGLIQKKSWYVTFSSDS